MYENIPLYRRQKNACIVFSKNIDFSSMKKINKFAYNTYDIFWIRVLDPLLRKSEFFRSVAIRYSYMKRKNRVPPVPEEILKNKEGFTDFDIPRSWFTEEKKLGISGIARLKNSADFLEPVAEAFLPYLDEIILVAEQANDGTNEICEKLAEKYPEKIRYYFYPHQIIFRDYDGDEPPTSDSIHSFSYFTNWAFSKSTYKYVMRLDDDILPIPETWEKLREHVLTKQPNTYMLYYGINLLREGNRVGIMRNLPRCGTWGDNGIYPVSEHSYFSQIPGGTERFHLPLLYEAFEF